MAHGMCSPIPPWNFVGRSGDWGVFLEGRIRLTHMSRPWLKMYRIWLGQMVDVACKRPVSYGRSKQSCPDQAWALAVGPGINLEVWGVFVR